MKEIIVFILLFGIPSSGLEVPCYQGDPIIYKNVESAALDVMNNDWKDVKLFKATFKFDWDYMQRGAFSISSTPKHEYKVEEIQIPKVEILFKD